MRFPSSSTPANEDADMPIAVRSAGKVAAIKIGRAVCIEKYIGNSADCNVANCGRGRARKDTMPAMKDWNTSLPSSVP